MENKIPKSLFLFKNKLGEKKKICTQFLIGTFNPESEIYIKSYTSKILQSHIKIW